jgi:tetratricopeptide (TPR) repeat protein
VALRPEDADAHLKLGSALFFGLGRPAEALASFAESVRLAPDSALGHGLLALALGAAERPAEALAEFEIALRLDERLFDQRPAMAAAYEAAQRGEAWP